MMKLAKLCLALLATGAMAATNLVVNGDFEAAAPSGWALYVNSATGATGAATVAYNGSTVHGGVKAAQVNVTASSTENWHVQIQVPAFTTVSNKLYRLSYWAKGPGPIHVGISNAAYAYLTGFTHSLSSSWAKYTGTFVGDGTLRRMGFYLASTAGAYSFDDVVIEEIATIDPNWYASAEARIEANRKGNFGLQLLNASGNPVSGSAITVKLLQHEFALGTALNFQNNADDAWYKQMVAKYFWAGVTENAFKWPSFEPSSGNIDTAGINNYLNWTEAQGFGLMRGHALEWGIEKYSYETHWPRLGTRTEYMSALKNRIQRDLTYFKGRFKQYDVWNEVFHEPAIFDKFGWDLLDSALCWARATDPTAKLYLNEYSVVEGGETDRYIDIVQGLQARNVPLDGIGVQGHFFDQTIDPALIGMRLDMLATLGLPIMITEFDLGGMSTGLTLTPQAQAVAVAKFMRTAYSHPSVAGIILWGFWDSRHWIPNGGIIEEDKTAKPAADSLWHLWREVWTTNSTGTTPANGAFGFRGFPGKYEVIVGSGTSLVRDTLVFGATNPVWTIKAGSAPVPVQRSTALSASSFVRIFDIKGRTLLPGIEKINRQ